MGDLDFGSACRAEIYYPNGCGRLRCSGDIEADREISVLFKGWFVARLTVRTGYRWM